MDFDSACDFPRQTIFFVFTKYEGQITNFGEKNPQVHLIIIREWPKNTPSLF